MTCQKLIELLCVLDHFEEQVEFLDDEGLLEKIGGVKWDGKKVVIEAVRGGS